MEWRLILVFLFAPLLVLCQPFTITRVELNGPEVVLFYDLSDTVTSRTYTVELYSSMDNFVSRLEKVRGDVGIEVKPGVHRKIVWLAKQELGSVFSGKVSLEVRGRVYIPFVLLEGLNKEYKRGKPYPLTWTGGTQLNILNFDLYHGEEKIHPFSNIANVGEFTFTIPASVKPGKDYYFRITDSRNKEQVVVSKRFAVKRKVPTGVKLIPLVAAGVLFATFNGATSSSPALIPDPQSPAVIR